MFYHNIVYKTTQDDNNYHPVYNYCIYINDDSY